MNRLLYIAKVLTLCFVANSAYAERLYEMDIETVRGLVEVEKDQERWLLNVKLNGVVIFSTENHDGVFIEAVHSFDNEPALLLLHFYAGNACEGFFRVLDLRSPGAVKVSEEFGNCNYLVQPKEWKAGNLKGNPSYQDGAWCIALPSRDNPSNELTWYVYKDGVVTEKGKGLVENKGDDWRYEEKLAREIPDEVVRKKLIEQYGSAAAAFSFVLNKKAEEKLKGAVTTDNHSH